MRAQEKIGELRREDKRGVGKSRERGEGRKKEKNDGGMRSV